MVSFRVIRFILLLGPTVTSSPTFIDQSEEVKSYEGYKLLRTANLPDGSTAKKLMSALDSMEGVNFWTFPKVTQRSDILVSPDMYSSVKKVLDELNIDHGILQENIAKLIEAEKLTEKSVQVSASGHNMNWTSYQSYDNIYGYCQYLAQSQQPSSSGAVVTMETIGKTTEGRTMVVMRLGTVDKRKKRAIWLDAGIHAREWISPATVTYILNTLVTDKEKSSELLNEFDWYIVPVINIDGYEYSRTADRMWRKTRSVNRNSRCRGTDPNRNFAYKWGGQGSSHRPCDETYAGTTAFSEPETRAIRDTILNLKDDIVMYISFHSYSQLILVPWSGDTRKPADYQELYQLGVKGQEGIRVPYRTEYEVGTAPDKIYVATGGADDWAKAVAGIKYSYTYELRDKGRNGFILPANQIVPSGIETFNGVKAMALALKNLLKKS